MAAILSRPQCVNDRMVDMSKWADRPTKVQLPSNPSLSRRVMAAVCLHSPHKNTIMMSQENPASKMFPVKFVFFFVKLAFKF